jgi:hypothetical protein
MRCFYLPIVALQVSRFCSYFLRWSVVSIPHPLRASDSVAGCLPMPIPRRQLGGPGGDSAPKGTPSQQPAGEQAGTPKKDPEPITPPTAVDSRYQPLFSYAGLSLLPSD